MQPFDKEYVCDIAKQILNIDSPTGYTKRAIDFNSSSSHTVSISAYDIKLIPVISYSASLFVFPHPAKLNMSANTNMTIILCFIDTSILYLA